MKKEPYDPAKGEESVWDYPRPPKIEATNSNIKIFLGREQIVGTKKAFRVLETSHPPVYYIPPSDIVPGVLTPTKKESYCEFKGKARYYSVQVGELIKENACWYYPNPVVAFQDLKDYVAFYPNLMERCEVDGEVVDPQLGDFYGGWVTRKIKGPFKGGPGTWGW